MLRLPKFPARIYVPYTVQCTVYGTYSTYIYHKLYVQSEGRH